MNLRFWEWDRVFVLAVMALLVAIAISIYLSVIPYVYAIDEQGHEIKGTIWQDLSFWGALLVVSLPILITLSPLTVLSKAGGIGRQQLINLWLAFFLMGFMTWAVELSHLFTAIFSLSAAVAGTVRRKPTAIGRTATQSGQSSDGPRLSRQGRRQKKRRGGR